MRSILGPAGIDTIGMEMQLLKPASQAMIKKKKMQRLPWTWDLREAKSWNRKAEGQGNCMNMFLKEIDQRVKVG